jgi:predicted DsbA family dithiol-disulfide isomerase
VPFFRIDERFVIPGAQAPETIRAILDRAWAKSRPA